MRGVPNTFDWSSRAAASPSVGLYATSSVAAGANWIEDDVVVEGRGALVVVLETKGSIWDRYLKIPKSTERSGENKQIDSDSQ